MVPLTESAAKCSLPSTGFPWAGFACFRGTMEHSDFLRPSRRTSLVVWRYQMVRPHFRSHQPETLAAGPEFIHPVSATGSKHLETTGSPKFLGNPSVSMPCSPTPAGPTHQAMTMRRRGPHPVPNSEGSLRRATFRGSMTRPGHSLSTLRPDGRPPGRKTRFPLSATLYGTGLATRRVPTKGFENASYIPSSFPRLCLAQWQRCHFLATLPPSRGPPFGNVATLWQCWLWVGI